ncbi:hypothetical protein LTR08_000654 [Meristemomyces frigidus]|nr:hypothetical protein LTR08_000654 [Meristemomyces frigidus]
MSIRGERVVVRERDREVEKDWEPRKTYTTVKRYQVPETARSVFRGGEEEEKDTKIVIRRREASPTREEIEYKITERVKEREREREAPREEVDYRFTERIREHEREPPRRDIAYRVVERDTDFDRRSAPRSEFRVVDRETRAPSPEPERVREFRFEREREYSPPRRPTQVVERPFDVERYSKSTEYFSQPQPAPQQIIIREAAPQPIIIREERREPIIIREERREPAYEFIEREEVRDDRSLVRREEPPPPVPSAPSVHSVHASVHPSRAPTERGDPEEENYFYERRVREIERPRRRDESEDRRTEVRPRDSASHYSSDDSYEYVRRERTYDDDGKRSRSRSDHRRRHLAEGAIAGLGAAEIFGHHRKSQGKDGGNRLGRGVAGAALGAVGAEAISRVRSRSRRRKSISRSRSRSSSYDSRRTARTNRRDKKKRSRSRSKSLSRRQQIGAGLAVAAVGALAGYALKNRGNKETVVVANAPLPRRSRSRRRRASVDSYQTEPLSEAGGRAPDPEHRNRRIAQAGLASAAAAGIFDRVRSKSRGGRDRSQSRVRQGVPIAAAGLGGAALAGLYERSKAGKEAKKAAVIADEMNRGRRGSSRRRSRSRSRSVPAPYVETDSSVDDQGMIAYGNEPVYPDSRRGYYSDEEPGMYRRRHRGGSGSGSSPDTRQRSRSRGKNIAEVGAAAGVAAVAAHEIGKRRERSRSRQRETVDRRHRENNGYDEPYRHEHEQYDNAGYPPPQQPAASYDTRPQQYPGGNYFPPPPTDDSGRAETHPAPAGEIPYPAYNPADYAPGAHNQPYPQSYGAYDSEANLGAPYPGGETFAGDPRYGNATPTPAHAQEGRRGREPDDVSAPPLPSAVQSESQDAGTSPMYPHVSRVEYYPDMRSVDGVTTPRAERSRSRSRVRFDLASNTEHFDETQRKVKEEVEEERQSEGGEANGERKHRRRKKNHGARPSSQLMNDKYDREPRESDSDGTVDLPSRFDEHGNRADEGGDQLTSTINNLLGQAGFTNFLNSLGGGGAGADNEDDGRSGRRRHRR